MTSIPSNPVCLSPAKRLSVLRQFLQVSGLITTVLLCGCASRAPWKKESFALATPSAPAGPAAHTNILSLHRVTVSPLFAGQPLVYRTGENSYERDPYAEFLVPPNQMLEQCLRSGLRNGHAFAQVLDPGSELKPSCAVEVSATQLCGDFRQPGKPFAVLQLRFLLYSIEPAHHGRELWEREFTKRLPFTHRTPAALVAGWNAGLQQIMEEVNTELNRLAVPKFAPATTSVAAPDVR